MARRAEPLVRSVEQLKEGAKYLKIADQLVREGKYDIALKEIAKARAANPSNLYALAYEDRVRSLLQAKDQGGEKSRENRGRLKPAIEQLSSLAVVQAQRSLDNELKKEKALQNLQQEADERRSLDEVRRVAIQEKIQSFITRVIEYQAKADFTRALAEIDRAYLLDPMNEQVRILEGEIRNQLQEANKQKELEQQRLREEEEHQRSDLLSSEQKKIQQEIEEKKQRSEEARRVAQERKVHQYIHQSKHLLAAGQLDDALSELAFVVVIDPLNEDVLSLERVIRERMEMERREQLVREEKEEEEREKRIEAVRMTIAKHIERADKHAREGEFDEALRVVTRAYVIDPLSKDLQECEKSILAQQERALTEEQVHRKEERAKQREEELRGLKKAERGRLLEREHVEEEKRKREEKNKIGEYLSRARKYAQDNQFESALGELALAFVLDPFDEEVKEVEQEIGCMREGISLQAETHPNPAEEAITHYENAQRMRQEFHYEEALEELARAFVLDPLNPAIQKLDDEIHEEYRAFQSDQKRDMEEQAPSARQHLWRAMDLLDRSEYEDALREVKNGLSLEPENEDLLTLRSEIEKIVAGTSSIEECIARAGEFLAEGKYQKALKEVEEGLNEFPNSIELLGLRSEIENIRDGELERIIAEARRLVVEEKRDDARLLLEKGLQLSPDHSLLLGIERELRDHDPSGNGTTVQIRSHIEKAKENLHAGTYEEALAQIALGLTAEPENKELRDLEAEAWRRNGDDRPGEDDDKRHHADEIKKRLEQALEFHSSNDFASALDEVAKAYALDPLNPEIRSVESRIRQTELRQQQEETPLKLIYPDQKRVGHS
ncbi:MAG TPA: hypothetical protein VGB89_14990 [Bacteroidota bacterium]